MTVAYEAQEQVTVFEWAAYQAHVHPELELLYHIPNGGSRNVIEAYHLRKQGVRAGVPDLCLPVARNGYHGLYIEMKRRKGGQVSVNQKRWLIALQAQGYKAVIACGADEAIRTILSYLEGVK